MSATENTPAIENGKNPSLNFIELMIEKDLQEGKLQQIITRFPPEPNGHLHIGHAKAISLDFGLAQKYNGKCNLRFDDTNPVTEEDEYVQAIKADIAWLGFKWDNEFYASDYFDQLYDWAIKLIKKGKAYVDDFSADQIAATKGTPTQAGVESPHRNRSVEENLRLLEGMKNGEYDEGARVLRAKIDMASPNMHMRDPVMYRIKKATHHRTGDKWCIYPMYDYAHGQSDYIEGITNSLCTLEFEVHRPLYDWFLDQILDDPKGYRPRQTEFARLNVNYTIMSKRKMLQLVEGGYVRGWDDPRMPTISGMRRRGYTPKAIRNFAEKVGIAKRNNIIDIALLEHSVREDLNIISKRVFAVMDPIKVVITNYPEGKVEEMQAVNNPEDPEGGKRPLNFSRELYLDRDDFMENPPKGFFRLGPGGMVRLKYAFIIKCNGFTKDDTGKVTELQCEYIPESRSGSDTSGIKVKGTIHWLSAKHAVEAEIRMYDRLFNDEDPAGHKDKDFLEFLNPDSLKISKTFVEESLLDASPLDHFQFERKGYFNADVDFTREKPVFNLTVPLRDTWAKVAAKNE
ncbi:MAG: glutamine--tRNA ligase/YqeY domain fusion protein [Cyclobacteriaceae bacterium]|nr:glutamine--tRNA ligase/YqeY domain fusion protein [Cyclobacteriaceae bacterium]